MSMEMHVLFRGKLPNKAALTRAMKELGFPFSIAPPGGSLEQQSGFMPMRFRREEAGVEFDVFSGRAEVQELAGDHAGSVDTKFDRSANFRWGGDESEMLSAMCAAAALAKLVNGVVLEDEEGLLLSVDDAIEFARKHLGSIATPSEKHPGTRPADIKRYLKPLLKQRSDLALIGRVLVVRPVRHLLRGALLDRTSDKYSFRIWSYIKPLYGSAGGVGFGDYFGVANCEVWQPHFQPLLIDALAEDILTLIGGMTSFGRLATFLESTHFSEERITALVLAGELERASECVSQIQDGDSPEWIKRSTKAHWDHVSGDIEAVCNEFHAKEAATVKELKLEGIWEPSPFPVELPVEERAGRTEEPAFAMAPWVDRPDWLLAEAPQQTGEVRFAKGAHYRNGRIILQVPLTTEQAEERHRELEDYTLAARLPEGPLLLIRRSGWDLNNPEIRKYRPDYRPSPHFNIEFYASDRIAHLSASQDKEDESLIELWSITAPEWHYHANLKEGERGIHDSRVGKMIYSRTAITSAERGLIRCPMPAFGEYAELVACIRSLLLHAGYGELT